jgi:GNAT superfamily N-acetyltransferase
MAFALRDATDADYSAFVRLFPELAVEDPVPTREQFAAQMLPKIVIVEDANGPVGYAFWRTFGRTAHVVHAVVDPLARGRGLGRALMEDVRRRVLAQGCNRWFLNVKQDNSGAIRLYTRCGLATEQRGWALRAEWSQLHSLPEPQSDVVAFTLAPEEDSSIAARIDETPEHLASLRSRAGVVLVGLREAGLLVGFAAFDPSFPGVRPVHVARVELAGRLFEGLRPYARHDHVHVTFERNQALLEALTSLGAKPLIFPRRRGQGDYAAVALV